MAASIRKPALARPVQREARMTRDASPGIRWSGQLGVDGVALALSGVLFLAKAGLDIRVGDPPSGAAELVAWRSAEKFFLALTNEILFFAVVLLVPGVLGLYASLAGVRRRTAAWGCALIAAVIPVLMALTIVHGRLPFPVYGIELQDAAAVQLVVSVYYGGQHAASLLFALATVLIAVAMRSTSYGRPIVLLGVLTAVGDMVGAYPWLAGPVLTTASEVLFAGWFIAVGVRLATAEVHLAAPRPQPGGRGLEEGARR